MSWESADGRIARSTPFAFCRNARSGMALQYQGILKMGLAEFHPRPVWLHMVARYAAMSYGFSGTSRFCIAISLLLGKAVIRYNYIGWGEGGECSSKSSTHLVVHYPSKSPL